MWAAETLTRSPRHSVGIGAVCLRGLPPCCWRGLGCPLGSATSHGCRQVSGPRKPLWGLSRRRVLRPTCSHEAQSPSPQGEALKPWSAALGPFEQTFLIAVVTLTPALPWAALP